MGICNNESGNRHHDPEFCYFDNERVPIVEDSMEIEGLGGKIIRNGHDSGIASVGVVIDFNESFHARNQASERLP